MTIVICEKHGGNFGVDVSRDALTDTGQMIPNVPLVLLGYDYEGQAALRFWVTHSFLAKWHLEGMTISPLPDNYPKWISEIAVVCGKCFEDATGIDASNMA